MVVQCAGAGVDRPSRSRAWVSDTRTRTSVAACRGRSRSTKHSIASHISSAAAPTICTRCSTPMHSACRRAVSRPIRSSVFSAFSRMRAFRPPSVDFPTDRLSDQGLLLGSVDVPPAVVEQRSGVQHDRERRLEQDLARVIAHVGVARVRVQYHELERRRCREAIPTITVLAYSARVASRCRSRADTRRHISSCRRGASSSTPTLAMGRAASDRSRSAERRRTAAPRPTPSSSRINCRGSARTTSIASGSRAMCGATRTRSRRRNNLLGTFAFNSLSDLQSARPASFARQLTAIRGASGELIGGLSIGDSYRPTYDLQIIYGARIDANRFLDRPSENADVKRLFGVSNDGVPDGLYVSPRIGFSWTYGAAPQISDLPERPAFRARCSAAESGSFKARRVRRCRAWRSPTRDSRAGRSSSRAAAKPRRRQTGPRSRRMPPPSRRSAPTERPEACSRAAFPTSSCSTAGTPLREAFDRICSGPERCSTTESLPR